MNSEARSEFNAEYDDRVQKIRRAAAIALKELDQLRSGGPVTQEALDAEVARIAREKLQPHGCDLVVHRTAAGIKSRLRLRHSRPTEHHDIFHSGVSRWVQTNLTGDPAGYAGTSRLTL